MQADEQLSQITEEMTYSEIAVILGVSVERVRQIEANAMKKIRFMLRAKGVALDDFLPTDAPEHPLMRNRL